jgi:hypothetical protein
MNLRGRIDYKIVIVVTWVSRREKKLTPHITATSGTGVVGGGSEGGAPSALSTDPSHPPTCRAIFALNASISIKPNAGSTSVFSTSVLAKVSTF